MKSSDHYIFDHYTTAYVQRYGHMVVIVVCGGQVNFFQDHTKVILCPLMGAVTYIDEKRDVRTYRLVQLEVHGCDRELETRLRYVRTMVDRLMAAKSSSTRSKAATTTTTA